MIRRASPVLTPVFCSMATHAPDSGGPDCPQACGVSYLAWIPKEGKPANKMAYIKLNIKIFTILALCYRLLRARDGKPPPDQEVRSEGSGAFA
jgi:hypothetical protein